MDQPSRNRNSQKIMLIGMSGCLFLLTCLFVLGAGALVTLYYFSRDTDQQPAQVVTEIQPPTPTAHPTADAALAAVPQAANSTPTSPPTPTFVPTPTLRSEATPPASSKMALTLPADLNQQPIPERAFDDLDNLYQVDYPAHDYFITAETLGGFELGPRELERPAFYVGDRQVFHTDEGNVEATLVTISDHTYFWVDDALYLEETDLIAAAQRLENEFYPRINHLFDQPWSPGIDGDPRFSILHLAGHGDEFELGYFSDQDEYPRTLFRDSNEQEIIYLNMGQLDIGSDLYYGTLVHELQHLFQWNLDKNEATWLNEGLSQLAELYAGLETALPDAYLAQPDTRLDQWEYDEDIIDAHYANSYLFAVYLWDQLGEMGVYELVRQPANGLASVAILLDGFQPDRSLEQLIADWTVANFLNDPKAGEQYAYKNLQFSQQPTLQARVRQLPFSELLELDQLAVHYIDLDHTGPLTLTFAGDTTATLVDAPPASGDQMWYAPPSNDTHAQLTAAFDLSQINLATLEFDAWYDLEEDFDFAYLSASSDQGASWRVLAPNLWSTGDYGPGFTGSSANTENNANGWIHETISLDSFAGQEILLRFHVLTDFESVGRGFAIDNIAIPELAYSNDGETTDSQWQMNGFTQTGWLLPQLWAVRLIHHGPDPQVDTLHLDPFNQLQETVQLGQEGGTLVIIPLTPFVDETAHYWLQAAE